MNKKIEKIEIKNRDKADDAFLQAFLELADKINEIVDYLNKKGKE